MQLVKLHRDKTVSQHNDTKQKSEHHKEICHNLGKLSPTPLPLRALLFFVFFSLHCSVGECQAGSSHLTEMMNPTVDVNPICTVLRMVKLAMKSASCWGLYGSFMGKFDPSNPLLYISSYWKVQL